MFSHYSIVRFARHDLVEAVLQLHWGPVFPHAALHVYLYIIDTILPACNASPAEG